MVVDPNGGVTRYGYDAIGNLIQTQFPNGVTEIRRYNDLNQLEYLETSKLDAEGNKEILTSYTYMLDKVGHRLSVKDHTGRFTEYDYDDIYRLEQEKVTLGGMVQTIDFTYDKVGNRLSQIDSTKGTTTYVYDDNDRLLTEILNQVDDNTVITSYDYDNNGNEIAKTVDTQQTTYTWNDENRLVEVETPDGRAIGYTYDTNGIRVSSTVDGVTTQYLIDNNRDYAQVLEEYVDGDLTVRYVYGRDLISQEQGSQNSFYLVDGLGSTTALANANGNVTDTYTYDAFGKLINKIGITENSYQFTGEQYDQNLDEYYLRQRYYNSNIGRFTRRDIYEGQLLEPSTLHKYLYTHNNPINYIDPSGLIRIDEALATLQLQAQLLAIRFTPVFGSTQAIATKLLQSGMFYVEALPTLVTRGLVNTGGRSLEPVIQGFARQAPGAVSRWTNGITEAQRHFFNRAFSDPTRFAEITQRLGEASFRFSSQGFQRFTQLADEIAHLPAGASRFGQVFRISNGGKTMTFVRTRIVNGNPSQVGTLDEGVQVIMNGDKIATFREAAGQVFRSGVF